MNIPNGICALGEKGCFTDGKCYYNGNCENKVVTHADRIRAMSDEELADILTAAAGGSFVTETGRRLCYEKYLDFLKQPVKDGEDE